MNKFFREMLEFLADTLAQANREALDRDWQEGFEAGYEQRDFEVAFENQRKAQRDNKSE